MRGIYAVCRACSTRICHSLFGWNQQAHMFLSLFRALIRSVYFVGKLYCKCQLIHNCFNECKMPEAIDAVFLINQVI